MAWQGSTVPHPFCIVSLAVEARVNDLVSRNAEVDKPSLLTARAQKVLSDFGVPAYY